MLNNIISQLFKKLILLIGIITALPFRLMLVVLSPIVLIRLAFIDAPRMGPLTLCGEIYLTVNKKKVSKKSFDLFVFQKPVCNDYLKLMWSRFIFVLPETWFWKMTRTSYQILPFGHQNILNMKTLLKDHNVKILLNTKSHLNFNKEELDRGYDLLDKLGIKLGSRWICFHNRDDKYLENLKKNKDFELVGNFDYHRFRDFSIHTMSQAAEELTKRGYYVVRVGSVQKEKMKSDNPMIIDYSSSRFRSDFGDIFLGGDCDAYIGSDSGTYCVPLVFRKPFFLVNTPLTVLDNMVTQMHNPYPFITKHLFDLKKKRNLSLREMFESGLFRASKANQFKEACVEVVPNTSEEIFDLTNEAVQRLNGTWKLNKEDEFIQVKFWNIFFKYSGFKKKEDIPTPVCASFLHKNQYLLN